MISLMTLQLSNNCSKSTVKTRRWRNFRSEVGIFAESRYFLTGLCYSRIYKICHHIHRFPSQLMMEATEKLAMFTCLMSDKS